MQDFQFSLLFHLASPEQVSESFQVRLGLLRRSAQGCQRLISTLDQGRLKASDQLASVSFDVTLAHLLLQP
jgi:hypothetical protein